MPLVKVNLHISTHRHTQTDPDIITPKVPCIAQKMQFGAESTVTSGKMASVLERNRRWDVPREVRRKIELINVNSGQLSIQ